MIPAVDYTVQAANGKNLKAAEAASKQWVDSGDIPIKTIDRSVPTITVGHYLEVPTEAGLSLRK